MHDPRHTAAECVDDETQRSATDAQTPTSSGRWAWEWIRSFLIAFGLFLVIRTFLVEAFRIPTGSMENTLLAGDFLLVNKAVYGAKVPLTRIRTPSFSEPARGDVVVFEPPHEPGRNYVKRLIGMPGDTLEMRNKTLFLNGRPQHEPYTRHSDFSDNYASDMFWQCEHAPDGQSDYCRPTRDSWGPVVVPAGHYFMLGDNRDDSEDSRYWGFVERSALKGRPLFIYYSYDPASGLAAPWLRSIRWGRIGSTVD